MTSTSTADTIVSLLVARAAEDHGRPALYVKRAGTYAALTWAEIAHDVRQRAAALVSLGVRPGDRVAQLSENGYPWIISDLAIQMARGVHVPLHAQLAGPQAAAQIIHSGARLVIVSDCGQAGKLATSSSQLPRDLCYVSYDSCPVSIGESKIRRLDEIAAGLPAGRAGCAEQSGLDNVRPHSPATILYTSGTSGKPKGVALSQRNLISNAKATVAAHRRQRDDRSLCFLPLSHIFARTCDFYSWMVLGSQLALAESPDTVLANCRQIHPTVLHGVPSFYQRVYRQFEQASWQGNLREVLGGRIRECCCGGAPVPGEVFDFFHQQGVPLLPGYGLTEASPVVAVSTPWECKRGSVGRPIPGVEVCIADDGEIWTRGPNVMVGFWRDPPATRQVIRDGWLCTGDLGYLDDQGFLTITGRKDEMIVMATGKNVAPSHLESLLCRDSLIDQAMVVGAGRSCLAALIVPDHERLQRELRMGGVPAIDRDRLTADVRVHRLYQQRVDRQLARQSPHEQVRRFALIDRPFRMERGEVTLKRSLCRKVIEANFAAQIEAMYRKPQPDSPGRDHP